MSVRRDQVSMLCPAARGRRAIGVYPRFYGATTPC
jgi:hypothetical protein